MTRIKTKEQLSSLGLDEDNIYSAAENEATNLDSLNLEEKKSFLKPVLLGLFISGLIGGGSWYLFNQNKLATNINEEKQAEPIVINQNRPQHKDEVKENLSKNVVVKEIEQTKELSLEEKLQVLEKEEAEFIAKQKEARARLVALKAKKAELDKEKIKQAAIALQEKELKEREEKLAQLKEQKQNILNAQKEEKARLEKKAAEVRDWHKNEQARLLSEKQMLEEKMQSLKQAMQNIKEKENVVHSTLINKQIELEQDLQKSKEKEKMITASTLQTEEEIQQMLAEINRIRNLSVSDIIKNNKADLQQLTPSIDINTLSFTEPKAQIKTEQVVKVEVKPIDKKEIIYSQPWQTMMLKKMSGKYDNKGTWLEVKIKNRI